MEASIHNASAEKFVKLNRDLSSGQVNLNNLKTQSIDNNLIVQIDPTIYMTDQQDSKISQQMQESKGPLDTSSRHFSDLP